MKVVLQFLSLSLAVSSVSAQCSLCPSSSNITDVNATLLPGRETCGDIEMNLMNVSNDECLASLSAANANFDYTAFCCDGVGISNIECPICENTEFDGSVVPIKSVNPQNLNCDGILEISSHVVDGDSADCEAMTSFSNQGCCVPKTAGCAVCSDNSTMLAANRVIPGTTYTCAALNEVLASQTDQASCTATLAPFTDYDLAAYCRCTGTTAPKSCTACENGYKDPNAPVAGTGGIKCSEFEAVADYVLSGCSNWQECCNGTPDGTTAPASASALSLVFAAIVGVLAVLAQA